MNYNERDLKVWATTRLQHFLYVFAKEPIPERWEPILDALITIANGTKQRCHKLICEGGGQAQIRRGGEKVL